MNDFFHRTYLHNTIQDYIVAFSFVLVGILLIKTFKKVILKRLKGYVENTTTTLDDYVVISLERFGIPALYFTVVYMAITYLVLSERVGNILRIAVTFVITFLVIRFLSTTILTFLKSYIRYQSGGEEKVKQLGGIMLIINLIIWLIGFLFLFDNMGYDVTAIIAGLGIGGIAIALAAQNILSDLFNYFVIFFDRPFEIGDFLIIDDKKGVVEYIGIKTTRIKSLSGEQLIFSNSDLTNSRIHNYKRMQRRRILFNIGVVYQTPFEKIKEIPGILKSAVLDQQDVEFDRSHFSSYGDYSINYEVVYFILSSDYNVYMDIQQQINFRIHEEFQRNEIDFAYPSQTLFIPQPPGGKSIFSHDEIKGNASPLDSN